MIHQIGRKLRQQIHYFSGELCAGIGKVSSRFIEEVVLGTSSSGSVRLTQISRTLEEKAFFIQFNFLPVSLPECPNCFL
ncbi:MAG: hypothetical protein K9L30_03345 [Desulfobacterales bacterium]|nr:hypothetical protein [Desulfobacterales bacterium]